MVWGEFYLRECGRNNSAPIVGQLPMAEKQLCEGKGFRHED